MRRLCIFIGDRIIFKMKYRNVLNVFLFLNQRLLFLFRLLWKSWCNFFFHTLISLYIFFKKHTYSYFHHYNFLADGWRITWASLSTQFFIERLAVTGVLETNKKEKEKKICFFLFETVALQPSVSRRWLGFWRFFSFFFLTFFFRSFARIGLAAEEGFPIWGRDPLDYPHLEPDRARRCLKRKPRNGIRQPGSGWGHDPPAGGRQPPLMGTGRRRGHSLGVIDSIWWWKRIFYHELDCSTIACWDKVTQKCDFCGKNYFLERLYLFLLPAMVKWN